MEKKYFIKAFYPNFYDDMQIAYVSLRIINYFNYNPYTVAWIMGTCSDSSIDQFRKPYTYPDEDNNIEHIIPRIYFDAIPRKIFWPLFSRLLNQNQIRKFVESRFLKSIKKNDIVYLWPMTSLNLYKKIKLKGPVIVSERINTLRKNSKEILDREYKSLNLPIAHGISDVSSQNEIKCMTLADFIFSPSPAVKDSLMSAGISEDKIIETSYGLKDDEILPLAKKDPDREITVLFVGSIGVRKGIHLLLNAWQKANVQAKLKIVGPIEPPVEELVKTYLDKNPNIEHVNFVNDLKPIYRDADIFVLPSLEEGSPLVTYLALGASLPVIVSPMGGGGVIEDGKEGIIIDPHNQEEFIASIRTLLSDDSLRSKMAEASGKKAGEYTWDRVSKRRIEMLMRKIREREE